MDEDDNDREKYKMLIGVYVIGFFMYQKKKSSSHDEDDEQKRD